MTAINFPDIQRKGWGREDRWVSSESADSSEVALNTSSTKENLLFQLKKVKLIPRF